MNFANLKQMARQQLGSRIFSATWMMALLICLIHSLIIGFSSSFTVVTLVVAGPMSYGLAYVFVKQSRDGNPMVLEDLFKGFKNDFSQNFLIGLMTGLFTALWSMLFVIPGIIAAYSYAMASYVKLDNPTYNWKQCIDTSKAMMKGHKMELFLLQLSFIGWHLLAILTFGIAEFWIIPYQQATMAHYYNALVAEARANTAAYN